jgi:hypothetical protein
MPANPGDFQRVFLVEGVNVSLSTSNMVYDQCCIAKYSARLSFWDRNPGLHLTNLTRGVTAQGEPFAGYTIQSIQGGEPKNGILASNYYLAQIDVKNPSNACNNITQEWGVTVRAAHCGGASLGTRMSQDYWKSPHHPVNTRFWFCIVSQPPSIGSPDDQRFDRGIRLVKDYYYAFELGLFDPFRRIPERVTATGLPPGLSLEFNPKPWAALQPDGSYRPGVGEYNPRIVGTPRSAGSYAVTTTASNIIGSTTDTFLMVVGPPWPPVGDVGGTIPSLGSINVGEAKPSAFHVGADPVSAIHVGNTQIYPYT